MPDKQLEQSFFIRETPIRNRLCVPPMVCGWSDESGLATERFARHYRALAEGGFGLIILEATCVTQEGRLSPAQLGLWEDRQIEPLRRVTDAVHEAGCPIFVQLHHAGVVGIAEDALCPDAYAFRGGNGAFKQGRRMTLRDIARIREAFVSAARRALAAGFDGVELHACHRYLLCQFLNKRVNQRDDLYGEQPEHLIFEIMDGIREETPRSFVLGARLGAFEPTLADGVRHAAQLAAHGADFLDVSYGFSGEDEPYAPADSPVKDVIYAAGEIKRHCPETPVFAVNGICTVAQARRVLEVTDVDMADIGRSALVDPDWARKALAGETPGACLHCAKCVWCEDASRCAGRRKMAIDHR